MSFSLIHCGPVSAAIWGGAPSIEDCDAAVRGTQAAALKLGRPIPLLSILRDDAQMPAPPVQLRMVGAWPTIIECASSLQFVNLTRGFRGARMSMLLTPLFLIGQRGKVGVHQELAPALAALSAVEPGGIRTEDVMRAVKAALKERT